MMATQPSPVLISDKQRQFLEDLLQRKAVAPGIAKNIAGLLRAGMPSRQASHFIGLLLRCVDRAPAPKPTPAEERQPQGDLWPTVLEGRYAVVDPEDQVLKFYQVDKPREGRWAGFTFLAVFASNERYPVKQHETKKRILDVIAQNPQAASARFGHEMGACGLCGRALTDEASRRRGIGPICAGKAGWETMAPEERVRPELDE